MITARALWTSGLNRIVVQCHVEAPNCRYLLLLWLAFMTERGTRSHTLSLIAPGPKPCPAAPTSCPRGP